MQKKGRAGTSRAGKIALYGMMTALAFLLSYVETLIPINLGVPGVKLGLANLASIVSLYLLGAGAAAAIALVRIVLVGFTFGNLSMMLYSLAGAAVSLLLMVLFRRLDWFGADWASRRNPGKPLKMSGFDKIYVNGSHKSKRMYSDCSYAGIFGTENAMR